MKEMSDVPDDIELVINNEKVNWYESSKKEEISNDDKRPPTLTEGIYKAVITNWEKGFNPMYKKHFLKFDFLVEGESLSGFYNILPHKHASYVKAGWTSNLMREYQDVLEKSLDRRDRIAPNELMGKAIEVEVVTKCFDSQGKELSSFNQFSRVSRMIKFLH